MALRVCTLGWIVLGLFLGCGQSPYIIPQQSQDLGSQNRPLVQENHTLRERAASLDQDNEELGVMLAQSRQRQQLLQDNLTAVREQLRGVSSQLAGLHSEKHFWENKSHALTTSMKRNSAVTIKANSHLNRELSLDHLPGINVRQDGDVLRVELPAEKLFQYDSAQFKSGGTQLIHSVGTELIRKFPNQVIGVEGHTDTSTAETTQNKTRHHLTLAQAKAVYNYLSTQLHMSSKQLFIVGYGGNHPVVSNATTTGRSRNRRVELVVYPETFGKK